MPSSARFEGSYGGDAGRIDARTRLECRICWHVYDPAEGCASWQVPPGTPFSALPPHWRCPVCDAEKSGFMALALPAQVDAPRDSTAAPEAPAVQIADNVERRAKDLGRVFEAVFRDVYIAKMREVPLVNKALSVQAIGFRPHPAGVLGILLTPWFMNLVLVPDEPVAEPVGARRLVAFGSGTYEFVVGRRAETGTYLACSLFSPPHEFTTQLAAIEVALAALEAIDRPEHRSEGTRAREIRAARSESEVAADVPLQTRPEETAAPTRRALLTGSAIRPASRP